VYLNQVRARANFSSYVLETDGVIQQGILNAIYLERSLEPAFGGILIKASASGIVAPSGTGPAGLSTLLRTASTG
jgi:hypothetical protein